MFTYAKTVQLPTSQETSPCFQAATFVVGYVWPKKILTLLNSASLSFMANIFKVYQFIFIQFQFKI